MPVLQPARDSAPGGVRDGSRGGRGGRGGRSGSRFRGLSHRSTPIQRYVVLVMLVLALVVAGTSVVLVGTARQLGAAQTENQQQLLPAVADAQDLLGLFTNQETSQRGYIITGQMMYLRPYQDATERIPGLVAELRQHSAGIPGSEEAIDDLVRAHDTWVTEDAAPEIAAASSGDLALARELVVQGEGLEHFDALRVQTTQVQDLLADAQGDANARIEGLTLRLVQLLLIALVLMTTMVALLYPALQRLVVRPLGQLARAAAETGAEVPDDAASSAAVAVTGPREIVATAAAVEDMRQRLTRQVVATRQAGEALAQRGPAVVALRRALAPGAVDVPGLTVAGRLQAAEGVLAGDWYDLLALPGGRMALVLGDVSGHGPVPAVFALRLKELIAAGLRDERLPGDALAQAARHIGETGEMFATVFVAVIDPVGGLLQHASAGHPDALLLPGGDGPEHARLVLLGPTGPLLSSLVATWDWETTEHRFGAGDCLLGYTDGLVETRDRDGVEFGLEGVLDHAAGATGGDLEVLIDDLLLASSEHGVRGAPDDSTIVACRRDR